MKTLEELDTNDHLYLLSVTTISNNDKLIVQVWNEIVQHSLSYNGPKYTIKYIYTEDDMWCLPRMYFEKCCFPVYSRNTDDTTIYIFSCIEALREFYDTFISGIPTTEELLKRAQFTKDDYENE